MKHHFAWVGAMILSACLSVFGQSADERYVQIYDWIQEADQLNNSGQTRPAFAKYLEAQTALKALQARSPQWNPKVVSYRLEYIASKLEPLAPKIEPAPDPARTADAETPPTPLPPGQAKSLQEEIGRLTAQNALLEAKLKEALSVQPAAMDPRELAKAEERITALQKERDLLKAALEQEQAKPSRPMDLPAVEQERQILAEVRQRLAQQTELVAALQRENEGLRKQIVELRSNPDMANAVASLSQELEVAKVTIAALQATNTALRTQQILMQNQIADLTRQVKRGGNFTGPRAEELEKQLAAALAKLAVYEANPVPYTPEELALFKAGQVQMTVAETAPKKRSIEVPPGAAPLLEEAKRAVENGRFEEAEKRLLEVLNQDERNVYTLGNLAAVQMEQKRLNDAEQTLKRALAVDAQDPASLFLMGWLRFKQQKFDEALEPLSLAAKLVPDDPRTQLLLGQTLIEKGQRAHAETALRKAVQLRPAWGEAHYHLAVVYATQEPSFKELADWHYQKAISSGVPRNPSLEKVIDEKKAAAAAAP